MTRRAKAWLRYNDNDEKRCFTCKRYRPLAEFNKSPNTADKLNPSCRECECKRARAHFEVHGNYSVHRESAARVGSPPLPRERYDEIINSPCAFGGGTRKEGIRIGVDRKNSHEGYTLENSQPCCAFHNALKNEIDDGPFRQHLEAHPELKKCANRGVRQKWGEERKPVASAPALEPDEPVLPLFDGVLPQQVCEPEPPPPLPMGRVKRCPKHGEYEGDECRECELEAVW
jgi:hypothetical protein